MGRGNRTKILGVFQLTQEETWGSSERLLDRVRGERTPRSHLLGDIHLLLGTCAEGQGKLGTEELRARLG